MAHWLGSGSPLSMGYRDCLTVAATRQFPVDAVAELHQ